MLSNLSTVVHVISSDKFTVGYINFMRIVMEEWNHYFIVIKGDYDFNIDNIKNIVVIKYRKELFLNPQVKKIFFDARKIIISGVFGYEKYAYFFPQKYLKKTYLQFWGGDFYSFRGSTTLKSKIRKILLNRLIQKCLAIVTLVQDDYKELCEIFPNDKKYFVAPVPADPKENINYHTYKKIEKQPGSAIRILIGNSATCENQHKQAFEMIEKYKDENIEVICPLSYGNDTYREEVIKIGKSYFGDKFIPVVDFMSKNDYVELLATCDIGIFNNNRQQALGNISILIKLEKKIFIRRDTSMWNNYVEKRIWLEDVEEIGTMSFEDFTYKNIEQLQNNSKLLLKDIETGIDKWRQVLCD